MALFDLDVWRQEFTVLSEAPHLALALVILVAVAVWGVRGHLLKTQIANADTYVKAAGVRVEAMEQRLALARDKEKDALEKRDEFKAKVEELREQIAAGAPAEQIADTSSKVEGALKASEAADSAVVQAMGIAIGVSSAVGVGKVTKS